MTFGMSCSNNLRVTNPIFFLHCAKLKTIPLINHVGSLLLLLLSRVSRVRLCVTP